MELNKAAQFGLLLPVDNEPANIRISMVIWFVAAIFYVAYTGINFLTAVSNGESGLELVGTLIGMALWPAVAVLISLLWGKRRDIAQNER